ncbi:MAG: peptidylprolyl isomerase [Anaerolineae bacterium]|nr:peptidylprolyl isomerase [Anaerolineae bacterium]
MDSKSWSERRVVWSIVWRLLIVAALIGVTGCNQPAETVPPPKPYVAPTETLSPAQPSATPTPTVAGATAAPTPEPEETVAAVVNGEPVLMAAYQKQVAEWETAFVAQNPNLSDEEKQEMLIQGRRQVLDVMIEQVLIEQAAARAGIEVTPEEVERVIERDIEENGGRSAFDAWLQANDWTYEEYQTRQRSMMISSQMFEYITRDVPTKAEQVHARHILVAAEGDARALLSELESGADFAAVAREHSLDPSTKESGGDLGFFPRGTLVVPEVEDVAFSLPVGQVSNVVQSAMGYHIIQVVERVPDRDLTEESWHALREATFRDWVSDLWASANIQILIAV